MSCSMAYCSFDYNRGRGPRSNPSSDEHRMQQQTISPSDFAELEAEHRGDETSAHSRNEDTHPETDETNELVT